jgi:hypothetical protein
MLNQEQLRGKARLDALLKSQVLFGKPASHDWDQWVLTLQQDSNDPDFSFLLLQEQRGAARRETERGHQVKAPLSPAQKANNDILEGQSATAFAQQRNKERGPIEADLLKQKNQETQRETRRGKKTVTHQSTTLVDAFGKPVPLTQTQTQEAHLDGQTGLLAPIPDSASALGNVRDGEHVWVGTQKQRIGDSAMEDDQFMSSDDAKKIPYQWSPQQIAQIQHMFGMTVTGVLDKQILGLWGQVIDFSAGYTQAGRNISPMVLLQMAADAHKAQAAASGGGRAGLNRTQVVGFLTSVMRDQVGREPTEAEMNAFFSAITGAGDVDPQQFAIDWIRNRVGGEAGAFSALNYYDAMLQVLAGNRVGGG